MDSYQEHRKKFIGKLENLLQDSPYNVNTMADIKLYKTIEKRGFFVRLKNAKITEDDLYKYALRSMTAKETLDWKVLSNGKHTNFQ